jgi:surface polysaccharide O-acyltransferase-like enzyme
MTLMKPAPHASLELLRTAAALAVVCVHGAAFVIGARPGADDSAWWAANILDAFSRWCVPVFVMISGALLLSGPADESAGAFYRRRAQRLWLPLLFWSVCYLLLAALSDPDWRTAQLANRVLHGQPWYHLWFVYMLPGLYLLTPFLRRVIAQSTRAEQAGLSLTVCALAALSLPGNPGSGPFFMSFLPFIGYFLLGHYLFTRPVQPRAWVLWAQVLIAGLGVALGAGGLRPWLGVQAIDLMYCYQNPLVFLMGVAIFQLGLRPLAGGAARLADVCVALAPLSFGIYLLHPLWLWLLAKLGLEGALWHPALGIPLTTLAAFSLSALSTALLLRIPFLKLTLR